MRRFLHPVAGLVLLAATLTGCAKLGFHQGSFHSNALPSSRELASIRYMSRSPADHGRRIYNRLGEARSCHDLEIAMRWNRPPDVRGGPFNDKMVYLTSGWPAKLPKRSEVFLSGVIQRGQTLSTGGAGWWVKLEDGTEVQAIEPAQYAEKQEESQHDGGNKTSVAPHTPGRMLCGFGVFQGERGVGLDEHTHVPLIALLFAMDRRH